MKYDFVFTHRNMNVQCRYKDGFAPMWDVYVRWPGYKNRKYFTSVEGWKNLPSSCEQIVKDRIDTELGMTWIDITTADYGTIRYEIKNIQDTGDYLLKKRDAFGHWLRYNKKEGRVEVLIDNKWDVYITDESIIQVDMWDRS